MDRSSLLVRSFAVVAGLLAFPAAAQTPSPISACYNTTNGALRVVASAADCRTAERFVTWSAGGGTGPQGDVGPSGGGIDKSRVYQRIAFVDVVRDFATTAEADCDDANDVLLSGGFWLSHFGLKIVSSYALMRPLGPSGWQETATSEEGPGTAQAIAYCLSVD